MDTFSIIYVFLLFISQMINFYYDASCKPLVWRDCHNKLAAQITFTFSFSGLHLFRRKAEFNSIEKPSKM